MGHGGTGHSPGPPGKAARVCQLGAVPPKKPTCGSATIGDLSQPNPKLGAVPGEAQGAARCHGKRLGSPPQLRLVLSAHFWLIRNVSSPLPPSPNGFPFSLGTRGGRRAGVPLPYPGQRDSPGAYGQDGDRQSPTAGKGKVPGLQRAGRERSWNELRALRLAIYGCAF